MTFISSSYDYAEDSSRKVTVKFGIVGGKHLIDNISHKMRLGLEYRSPDFSSFCEYFVLETEVSYLRHGDRRSGWYPTLVVIPRLALMSKFNQALVLSSNKRFDNNIGSIVQKDITEAFQAEHRNRLGSLIEVGAYSDLNVIFTDSVNLDDQIRRLLDIPSSKKEVV